MPINREMSAIPLLHRWNTLDRYAIFIAIHRPLYRNENTWNIWTGNVSVTDFNPIWWRERETKMMKVETKELREYEKSTQNDMYAVNV